MIWMIRLYAIAKPIVLPVWKRISCRRHPRGLRVNGFKNLIIVVVAVGWAVVEKPSVLLRMMRTVHKT